MESNLKFQIEVCNENGGYTENITSPTILTALFRAIELYHKYAFEEHITEITIKEVQDGK